MPLKLRTTLSLFILSLLIVIWGLFPDFVLVSYAKGIYPYLSVALRWISSSFTFALGDVLYITIVILLLTSIIKFIWRIRKKGWKRSDRIEIPTIIINTFLIFYISFKLLWGLNYSRPSITKELHISNDKYNVKELNTLGNYFIDKVNKLQPKFTARKGYDMQTLRDKAATDYHKSAFVNPFFTYRAPSVKPVLSNWLISKIGIEGYYNPLSGEANVNMALPTWVLPFVTCHEMAHQLGVAREDEANLVAYLVGSKSEDPNFRYSVDYNMLRYILLEIRFKSPEDYIAMRDKISPEVLADFKAENEFWAKYDGHMANYMGKTFDKFLKLNNQEKGIESYQDIVVWLWNLHKKEL